MNSAPRELIKHSAGWLLAHSSSQYNYRNAVFLLAHMRCGSTALSNILCSRADISGYGETHIRYDGRGALGRLAVNQRLRNGAKPGARFLFDKILHTRHDSAAPPAFLHARAIFMVREPEPAIRSITKLFTDLGRGEYLTHEEAGEYYVERLSALEAMWSRFDPARRIGLTHGGLLADPDRALAQISAQLGFDPPLTNSYRSPEASRHGGGGDPTESGKHSRIEQALLRPSRPLADLGMSPDLAGKALNSYEKLRDRFATDWPELAL
jgi:hypothetical protein